MKHLKFLCLILCTGFAGVVHAAPTGKGRVFLGGYEDWDAFTEKRGNNEKVCYAISVPKEKLPAKLKRGEVYIMITHWPKAKIENQVSVIMGYPAKKGSNVSFAVDKQSFKMFVDGDRAWAWDARQDNDMTNAMKKKSTGFVIKGTSAHGVETTDRYSLSGFTAAHNAITKACN